MKPHIISAAFALMALSAGSALANTEEAALTDDDELTLACFDLEVGYMTDFGEGLSVDWLYGGTIGTSYVFNATKDGFHKAGFHIGVYYGSKTTPALPDFCSQHNSQRIVPVTVDYSYHRNIADKCTAYVGARAGAFVSHTEQKWKDAKIAHTRCAPTVGIDFGLEYEISEKFKWNIGVRFDYSAAMLQECDPVDQATRGWVDEVDTVTTTIHTGFSYSF